MITRNFNLHLNAGHSIPMVINVNQYDQGEQWVFTLFNSDGTQYVPSTGAIVGIKSDGLGIINSGSVVDGNVVINETQQMTAAVGKAVFELLIDNQTHGTANFVVLVEPKPGDNADMSDSDLSLLQEAIDATSPLPTGGTVGQVLTKTANGSAWSDAGTPTQSQVAEAVSAWADENITVETGVVIDQSLSVQGAAADAKKTGDEISELKSEISSLEAIPHAVKLAMDNLFAKAVFKNNVTGDLATFHAWATAKKLLSISAVFEQGNNIITPYDSLDDLKQYLTVTANYDDSTSAVVSGYTLNGTLAEGTCTISVEFEGKTASFSVVVSYHYSYSYSNGEIAKVVGSVSSDANYGLAFDTNANRRSFFTSKGIAPIKLSNSGSYSETSYYPITVPPNATKWTVSITPTTQFLAVKGVNYNTETDSFSWDHDSGWVQTEAFTFEQGAYDVIFITTKYNAKGTSYPTEPTEISVLFE